MGTGIRLLVAALLLLGSACGDDGNAAPASTTTSTTATTTAEPQPVGGLVATVGTNRLFQPRRELGLGLRNVSGAPITVTGFQLVSPRFAPVDPEARTVVLPPGRRLVIPLPYGPVRCDGAGDAYDVAVVRDDGRRVVLPAPEDRAGSVDRVHQRECAAEEVRELVDLRFEGGWARDGVSIAGELVLERRRPGPAVAVDDVTGNVLFTLRLGTDERPVLTVDGDRERAAVPVTISADRCDSHAVAEFKRPMVFLSWIAVDGGGPTPVELQASGDARAALESLLASC